MVLMSGSDDTGTIMDGIAFSLQDLLSAGGEAHVEMTPSPLPEAVIMRLRDRAEHFAKPFSFKVGDLVTPLSDSPFLGHGEPQVVIEINPDAEANFKDDISHSSYGVRATMRILCLRGGERIVPFWVDHRHYEHYTGEGA